MDYKYDDMDVYYESVAEPTKDEIIRQIEAGIKAYCMLNDMFTIKQIMVVFNLPFAVVNAIVKDLREQGVIQLKGGEFIADIETNIEGETRPRL